MEDKWVFRIEEASHDLYNKDHEYKTVDRERLDGMEETLWDKLAIDKAMTYRGIQWMWEELWLIHSGNASYAVEA
ncbi:hypothetical protein PRZ48_011727 [Zasmidium cellare]|uniref:Uncharacterized protein n=1 Tax=Zasmidium cellare TaxID=395010 RepID=A0ABR0E768_ZASCE|nr:hypothetical protein PRZ48_011727 [Zasmidium cellare]